MKARLVLLALIGGLLAAGTGRGEEFNIPKGPCGTKEPAPPQRRMGGEGLPPLPLPATPQRRTERKRQPAPPVLIAKIQFGEIQEIQHDGEVMRYHDWNKDPGDIPLLLNLANSALGLRYTHKRGPLDAFPPDPAQNPIFYYTGSDAFQLSDAEVERLREFVRAGGTIWGDTCFGDPDFFKAFLKEMSRILPDRPFRRLDLSHPLFHCFYEIDRVEYTRPVPDAPNGEPLFFGVDLGCRTAIILSRYDLSCGWDGHIREGALSVHPNDARRLGVNMVAYALATYRIGEYQSTAKLYYEDKERARGDFQFAQAVLGENWDTQTNSIGNLLKTVATKTSAEVKFVHRAVQLGSEGLLDYPFLYMTGHYDFVLKDAEVQALRTYLRGGGFLLASPCCGSREFNKAFRREIARVLPGNDLQQLAADHAVYHILYDISAVQYGPYVMSIGEIPPSLPLEGISLGGTTPVIYCPYGLGGGWRGFDHPFGRDVAQEDATKLGVNIVLYSMTH